MLVLISVVVMGASLSWEVWASVGGLSLKYWEYESCDSGGLSSGDFSLYRSLKKVVRSSMSGSSHLALDLRSLRMAHHS